MSETVTLAHISDLHLPPAGPYWPWQWNMKRCVGLINWLRNRRKLHLMHVANQLAADMIAAAPDHFAVTGDLANFGLPGEFTRGLDWLQSLGAMERVSLVPGNHDIYTTRCDIRCLEAWASYMQSDAWGNGIAGAATDAGQSAEASLAIDALLPLGYAFPYVRRVKSVALVGVNSAVPTKLFRASGRVASRQLEALGRLLKRLGRTELSRVVLIHHPPLPGQAPKRRALEDSAALTQVLREHGAELVLHGHNHRDTIVWTPGPHDRCIPVVGIATGSAGRVHAHEPLARYNLYRFTGGPGSGIEIVTRGLAHTAGDVVELKRQMLKPETAEAVIDLAS